MRPSRGPRTSQRCTGRDRPRFMWRRSTAGSGSANWGPGTSDPGATLRWGGVVSTGNTPDPQRVEVRPMTASLLLALAATALPVIPAGALTAQEPDYRFSRAMRAGETLAI